MTTSGARAFGAIGCLALGLTDLAALDLWLAPEVVGAAGPIGPKEPEKPPAATALGPPALAATAEGRVAAAGASDRSEGLGAPRPGEPPAIHGDGMGASEAPTAMPRPTEPDARPAPAPLAAPPTATPPRVIGPRAGEAGAPGEVLVWFGNDRADVGEFGRRALDDVCAALRADSSLSVVIEGHTDALGGREYNESLALRRARAVADVLEAEGIAASRITAVSRGSTEPLDYGSGERAAARNRRAEIRTERGAR